MNEIVLLGAGAIGRGFLPWVIDPKKHSLTFVDSNFDLISRMKRAGHYSTYRVHDDGVEELKVEVSGAYLPDEFSPERHPKMAACFFSVGPRNVSRAATLMRHSNVPLILCENDPNTVAIVKNIVGRPNVYFAIPDVITSNTAPKDILAKDPLAVVTENGKLFIEAGAKGISGEIYYISGKELLEEQWPAKLYLHNTPHCIAAYLGALAKVTYVHEAMVVPRVDEIVTGAMNEMLACLKRSKPHLTTFLEWYAEKELSRFRCRQLYDPISRVAREPLRKLETGDRLIGAAQLCFAQGIVPHNILAGIVAALLFDDQNDPDSHLAFLRGLMPPSLFHRYVLGLRSGEPLDIVLRADTDRLVKELSALRPRLQ
ncbi:MAG: mannitol-1-phosphate 5-dehydrogenase [Alphaproteobacteria bacterium]